MDKHYDIPRLVDFYGEMLTERQREALRLYYDDDLSLSEAAEELKMSRQGVRASLQKGEEILQDMEQRLGLVRRFGNYVNKCEDFCRYAEKVRQEGLASGNKQLADFAETVIDFVKNSENDDNYIMTI